MDSKSNHGNKSSAAIINPGKATQRTVYIILCVVITSCIFMSMTQKIIQIQPFYAPEPDRRWTTSLLTTNISNISNAKKSFYTINNYKRIYNLCDIITITIQMQNSFGENKTCGGDFIWVWVTDDTQRASSVADRIFDNKNGTYTITIIPHWTGQIVITVSLVHSSEIVSYLRFFRDKYPARYSYTGFYKTKNPKMRKSVTLHCHVTTDMYIPVKERYPNMTFCNFTNQKFGFPWFCLKPKYHEYFTCDRYIIHNSGGSAKEFHRTIVSDEFVKNYVRPQPIRPRASNQEIIVHDEGKGISTTTCLSTESPVCTTGLRSNPYTVSGFYFNDTWTSIVCNNTHFQTEAILNCLTNSTLHFIGDSTLRQWYEYLVRFALKDDLREYRNPSHDKFGPHRAINDYLNITIDFKFHGYPMALGNIPVNAIHYVAEQLDAYQDLDNLIICLSLWAHFTGTNLEYYVKRLQSVKDAISRLRKRNSNVRIFIKSANTREYSSDFDRSNWYSWEIDKLMHQTFAGFPGVTILDVWDMTIGHRTGFSLHPKPEIISQEIDLFLSYLC